MRKKTRRILIALVGAVFVVSLGAMIYQQARYGQNDQAIEEAQQLAGVPQEVPPSDRRPRPDPAPANPEEEPAAPEEPPEPEPDPWESVDLEALREVNSDVVGWIAIPGTSVSYPLIRPRDNETYLNRSWDKRYTSAGSIFLDYRSAWEPRGFNTIVYGHNMRNRTMFGSLREYRKADYWKEHPEICLVDDEGVHYYDVFAAWEPRVTDAVFNPYIQGEKERQSFLETALARSVVKADVPVGIDSEILTLSTCTGVGHATRWIVQAALRVEEEAETADPAETAPEG